MNENTLIPINPEMKAVLSMVEERSQIGFQKLAGLNLNELKQLQRYWYEQAVNNNVITLLQVLLMQAGKPDSAGTQTTWQQDDILATYDLASASLTVRVNGSLVCATYSKGNEVFVPGEWLKKAMAALDRIEIENRRDAQNSELGQRRDLITLLGAKV